MNYGEVMTSWNDFFYIRGEVPGKLLSHMKASERVGRNIPYDARDRNARTHNMSIQLPQSITNSRKTSNVKFSSSFSGYFGLFRCIALFLWLIGTIYSLCLVKRGINDVSI